MSVLEPTRGGLCLDCGHLLRLHRDDLDVCSVPCYAVTGRHPVATEDGRAVEWRYSYCTCRHFITEGNRP
jgi:hypothetical protein